MYKRIYPNKNNTLFKNLSGSTIGQSGTVNVGSYPTLQIRSGDSESIVVLGFDISDIVSLLSTNTYSCKLVLWDAGTPDPPALPPQSLDLIYFEQNFIEGDGFFYGGPDALQEPSNYTMRDTINNWNGILFPVAATGTINIHTGFTTGDSFQIGGVVLTLGTDFALGPNDADTANNFVTAINTKITTVTAVSGYASNTNGSGTITITAATPGIIGNAITLVIVFSTNGHTVSGPTLSGGIDLKGLFPAITLNQNNQDFSIDVSSFIATALTDSTNPNFGLRVSTHIADVYVQTKFLHGRLTRTIFQPYLEFIIDDEVVDQRNNAVATFSNNFYLLSETGSNFVGTTIVATIQDTSGNVLATPTINNPKPGVYYISYTPDISLAGKNLYDTWTIDGIPIAKTLVQIKSPNTVKINGKYDGLFFGPTTAYMHANIRQNDIVKFTITSEIRNKGAVLSDKYEYRIVTTSDFEMVPWTPTNIYNNEIFFYVDTSFFYPEIEYEVFVRLAETNFTRTSQLTYRFRLHYNGPTHLDGLNASPYNDRNYIINSGKNKKQ